MTPIGREEAEAIEHAIAALEKKRGVEVVAAVVPRSDAYPESPWMAFAFGAAIAALALVVIDVGQPDWMTRHVLLLQVLAVLGSGAVAALAAHTLPPFARFFLAEPRMKAEVRQHAEVMFLTHELFRAPNRNAVLMLVSLFEHRVVIVPDVFYRGRIEHAEWERVVERMKPLLKAGRSADAFLEGLAALDRLFADKGISTGSGANALADTLIRGDAP